MNCLPVSIRLLTRLERSNSENSSTKSGRRLTLLDSRHSISNTQHTHQHPTHRQSQQNLQHPAENRCQYCGTRVPENISGSDLLSGTAKLANARAISLSQLQLILSRSRIVGYWWVADPLCVPDAVTSPTCPHPLSRLLLLLLHTAAVVYVRLSECECHRPSAWLSSELSGLAVTSSDNSSNNRREAADVIGAVLFRHCLVLVYKHSTLTVISLLPASLPSPPATAPLPSPAAVSTCQLPAGVAGSFSCCSKLVCQTSYWRCCADHCESDSADLMAVCWAPSLPPPQPWCPPVSVSPSANLLVYSVVPVTSSPAVSFSNSRRVTDGSQCSLNLRLAISTRHVPFWIGFDREQHLVLVQQNATDQKSVFAECCIFSTGAITDNTPESHTTNPISIVQIPLASPLKFVTSSVSTDRCHDNMSSDQLQLLLSCCGGQLLLHDFAAVLTRSISTSTPVASAVFLPDTALLATYSTSHQLCLFDRALNTVPLRLAPSTSPHSDSTYSSPRDPFHQQRGSRQVSAIDLATLGVDDDLLLLLLSAPGYRSTLIARPAPSIFLLTGVYTLQLCIPLSIDRVRAESLSLWHCRHGNRPSAALRLHCSPRVLAAVCNWLTSRQLTASSSGGAEKSAVTSCTIEELSTVLVTCVEVTTAIDGSNTSTPHCQQLFSLSNALVRFLLRLRKFEQALRLANDMGDVISLAAISRLSTASQCPKHITAAAERFLLHYSALTSSESSYTYSGSEDSGSSWSYSDCNSDCEQCQPSDDLPQVTSSNPASVIGQNNVSPLTEIEHNNVSSGGGRPIENGSGSLYNSSVGGNDNGASGGGAGVRSGVARGSRPPIPLPRHLFGVTRGGEELSASERSIPTAPPIRDRFTKEAETNRKMAWQLRSHSQPKRRPQPLPRTQFHSQPNPLIQPSLFTQVPPVDQIETKPRSQPPRPIETKSRSQPPIQIETEPQSLPLHQIETEPRSQPPMQIETKPRSQPPIQIETEPQSLPLYQIETKPRSQPPIQIETKPRSQPLHQIETKRRSKPPNQIETKPRSQSPIQIETEPQSLPLHQIKIKPRSQPPDTLPRSHLCGSLLQADSIGVDSIEFKSLAEQKHSLSADEVVISSTKLKNSFAENHKYDPLSINQTSVPFSKCQINTFHCEGQMTVSPIKCHTNINSIGGQMTHLYPAVNIATNFDSSTCVSGDDDNLPVLKVTDAKQHVIHASDSAAGRESSRDDRISSADAEMIEHYV